jgi:hypothetical protein
MLDVVEYGRWRLTESLRDLTNGPSDYVVLLKQMTIRLVETPERLLEVHSFGEIPLDVNERVRILGRARRLAPSHQIHT